MSYYKRKRQSRIKRGHLAYRGLKERTKPRYTISRIYHAEKEISELLNIDKSLVKVRPTSSGIKIKIPASINIDQNLESKLLKKVRSLIRERIKSETTQIIDGDKRVYVLKHDPNIHVIEIIDPK